MVDYLIGLCSCFRAEFSRLEILNSSVADCFVLAVLAAFAIAKAVDYVALTVFIAFILALRLIPAAVFLALSLCWFHRSKAVKHRFWLKLSSISVRRVLSVYSSILMSVSFRLSVIFLESALEVVFKSSFAPMLRICSGGISRKFVMSPMSM